MLGDDYVQSTCPFLDALRPRRLPLICPEDGRCSRPGPLFYLLKRGGRGAVGIPARLLYTDWSSFPVILVALRVDSGVPKVLIK